MNQRLKYLYAVSFLFLAAFWGCEESYSQKEELNALSFSKAIQNDSRGIILDVRTPAEFSNGHIPAAINLNWNSPTFENEAAALDKEKNIYVYCLSGGRSQKAAAALKQQGFTKVYELKGGLLKWRAENLPEEKMDAANESGLSKAAFDQLLNSDKKVLVDFYAEWCGPCKLMEPYLKEIERDMADKVKLVRIDIDKNDALSRELGIDALPVLHIYQNKKLSWANLGYIKKADVVKELSKP